MVRITEDELKQWFDLAERLDSLDSFNFCGVTLRKEKRRGGLYWYAYRRIEGKLISCYCGHKWQLREKLPHLVDELAKKARGEVAPTPASSKVDDRYEWFEKWIMG